MSQHDYVINNDSGATVRADINSALQAILSANSGTSAPSSTSAGMIWLDTSGGAPYTLKIRDAGNNHWLTLGSITDPGADGNLSVSAIEGTSVLSTGEAGASKYLREDGDGSCSWQALPALGKVASVLSSTYSSYASTTSTSGSFPGGLQVTITLGSASNKVLVLGQLNWGAVTTYTSFGYLMRNSSYISRGDSWGSRTRCTVFQRQESSSTANSAPLMYLDAPGSTGPHTYKLGYGVQSGGTVYLNRSYDTWNSSFSGMGTSSITILEITA